MCIYVLVSGSLHTYDIATGRLHNGIIFQVPWAKVLFSRCSRPCESAFYIYRSVFCLRIFNVPLDYIARNAPGAFSYLLYKLIMAFISRWYGGYYVMSYRVFASLTIALSFSNSDIFWLSLFLSCPCPSGKVVNVWKWSDRTIYTICRWEISSSVTPLCFTVHGHYHGGWLVFLSSCFYFPGKNKKEVARLA